MTFKKSLLIALLSFGVANAVLAETDVEKSNRAYQYIKQQNYTAAFPLIKDLAEKGYEAAQFNLGLMYREGQGITQSDKQAVYWWQKAAEQGYAEAQYFLGTMYNAGRGVKKDEKKATLYFKQACNNGHKLSCTLIKFREYLKNQ